MSSPEKKDCQCKKRKIKCVCRKKVSLPSSSTSTSAKSSPKRSSIKAFSSGYESTIKTSGTSRATTQYDQAQDQKRPPFPYSLNLEPNTYYYTKDGLVGSEYSSIYYRMSRIGNSIYDYITSNMEYTPSRNYFERIEKLRFRLPTSEEDYLKSKVPTEEFEKKIESVRKFRENNLDDCVSEDDQEFRAKHKCVHKYRLNDQGFPEPVLKDEDGNSLCSIPSCYSPSKVLIDNKITPLNCEEKYTILPGTINEHVDDVVKGNGPILLLEVPPQPRQPTPTNWCGRKIKRPKDTSLKEPKDRRPCTDDEFFAIIKDTSCIKLG